MYTVRPGHQESHKLAISLKCSLKIFHQFHVYIGSERWCIYQYDWAETPRNSTDDTVSTLHWHIQIHCQHGHMELSIHSLVNKIHTVHCSRHRLLSSDPSNEEFDAPINTADSDAAHDHCKTHRNGLTLSHHICNDIHLENLKKSGNLSGQGKVRQNRKGQEKCVVASMKFG